MSLSTSFLIALLGLTGAGSLPAAPAQASGAVVTCDSQCRCPCHGRDRALNDAKAEAEVETGGEAVSARWVRLPNYLALDPQGVETLVRVEGEDHGWRCFVDVVKMKVIRKEPIKNPASKVR